MGLSFINFIVFCAVLSDMSLLLSSSICYPFYHIILVFLFYFFLHIFIVITLRNHCTALRFKK